MQNFNAELFSRLFFLNLAKSFKIDENFSFISDQASPSASSQAEPPTPPRTPIIAAQCNQHKSGENQHINNNNDDAKENFEGNSSHQNTPMKFNVTSVKSESESGDYHRRSSQFNEGSNFSDDERGGRESVASESMLKSISGMNDESDHEESDCASSFDSSKLSLKNIENFLDKSPMVSFPFIDQHEPKNLIQIFFAEFLQPYDASFDYAK